MNQVAAKVVPALAAGCTMVLKPSEYSPFSAILWAKVMHEAGVPAGVFNLVNGDGPNVGAPLSSHREVDMVSFTGSTRAGTEVAQNRGRLGQARAPGTGRQIAERLAGRRRFRARRKQERAARVPEFRPVLQCADAHAGARRQNGGGRGHRQDASAETVVVGDPAIGEDHRGSGGFEDPIRSRRGIHREGYRRRRRAASPAAPDARRPAKGYFVKPTIFSNVRNDMTIAREEIFGPVLCILPYANEEEAVQIANDTPYGLAAYVWSQDNVRARRVGSRIRAGQVDLNGALGRHADPVRRLQDVGQRPRIRRVRLARLPGGQGHDRSRRRLMSKCGRPGGVADPPFCGSRT